MIRVFYRYLCSHWVETLRNCEFMASKPSKFRNIELANPDPLDCLPQLDGVVPRNILEKGLPPNLEKRNGPPSFPENFTAAYNDLFRKNEAMDAVLRILCLSDVRDSNTDAYMWKNYANNFSGVRIGIALNVGSQAETNFGRYIGRRVEYCDSPNLISAKGLDHPSRLSDYEWDVIFRKAKKFEIENEYRIVTARNQWVSRSGREYVRLLNENIAAVDVGCHVQIKDRKRLMKFCRRNFNLRRMSVAQQGPTGDIEYIADSIS